jgi:SMC interacting uncharacterized protein involved in chromosome segregation
MLGWDVVLVERASTSLMKHPNCALIGLDVVSEQTLKAVNKKMDSMMEQCKRIKNAETNSEKAEAERLKRDIDRLKKQHGYLPEQVKARVGERA